MDIIDIILTHRAGRIGASQSHSLFHTNSAQPSITLVKSIFYPQLFKITSETTSYGCKNEAKAINAYTMSEKAMSEKHKDFKVTKCGMFIDKKRPWLHAIFCAPVLAVVMAVERLSVLMV